jgi:hypothetical protein
MEEPMLKPTAALIALAASAAPTLVQAQAALHRADTARYEVTVTNLTRGQQFTPILAVSHRDPLRLFQFGAAASAELQALAEEGNTGPFVDLLATSRAVTQVLPGTGLTDPGASSTFIIEGRPFGERLSLAAMLIPTNDTFVALNAVDLPPAWKATTRRTGFVGHALPSAWAEPHRQSRPKARIRDQWAERAIECSARPRLVIIVVSGEEGGVGAASPRRRPGPSGLLRESLDSPE